MQMVKENPSRARRGGRGWPDLPGLQVFGNGVFADKNAAPTEADTAKPYLPRVSECIHSSQRAPKPFCRVFYCHFFTFRAAGEPLASEEVMIDENAPAVVWE
jgi:hypothetical protein